MAAAAAAAAPVFKILIDLDEYIKLLTLNEVVKKQEEEIKKHYQAKPHHTEHLRTEIKKPRLESAKNPNDENVIKSELPSSNETDAEFKSGAGDEPLDDDALISKITEATIKYVRAHFSLRPHSSPAIKQAGSGADDLIPQEPIPIDIGTAQFAPVEGAELKKSQLMDQFDLQKLLNGVPAEYLERAEKLLKELLDFPNEITWDSEGTIFVDQHSLPESNIYDLFPNLFKRGVNSSKVLHLKEIATKIASLGFGNLINPRLTSGLSRKKDLPNHNELRTKISEMPNWWYIGD
jgi:hypothetical protein